MEAIHILLQADSIQDPLLIDVLGQGQLHQDAMHILIRIVVLNHLQAGSGQDL
jgi:hypothetical protein